MKDLAGSLDKLRQEHLFRTRNINSSAQSIEPIINGKKVLSFCSNDYLGLANHPKVIESFSKAAYKFGVGSGASHLITGHHKSHLALEEELAEFIGCERALLFSTGYMANLGVVSALSNRDSIIYEDRLNHASLIDASIISRANLKRYQHLNTDELNTKLSLEEKDSKLILTDGVFSMDGTIAPVTNLQELVEKFNAALIVDDAHGIGVLGKQGKGCTEGLLKENTVLVGTLGKAFGTFGAFVAAKQDVIEWCIQKARTYIYTTALPPAIAEATRVSLQLIRDESWRRDNLKLLIERFRKGCSESGIPITSSVTPIQPIILGEPEAAMSASAALLKKGILVSAIRPPTVPKNEARLRISFSATHTKEHIDRLVNALVEIF